MKLVDMRGLKPRPFRGPGSTPGIGILLISLYDEIGRHARLKTSHVYQFHHIG